MQLRNVIESGSISQRFADTQQRRAGTEDFLPTPHRSVIHLLLLTGLAMSVTNAFGEAPSPQSATATPDDRQPSPEHSRGVPSDLFDDFESYMAGQSLSDQSSWFNLVDTNDTVLASGIDGQSGAHISDGSMTFGQVLAKQASSGAFGTLSIDAEMSLNSSYITIFPSSEAGFLNAATGFFSDQTIWVGQDFDESDGFFNFVPTGALWQEGQALNIAFETNSLSELSVYLDGRLIFAGKDTSDKLGSGSSPVDFVGVRSSNGEAGDSVAIDNVSDQRIMVDDGVGSSDLYHTIGTGTLELFDKIVSAQETFLGSTFKVSTITFNTDDSNTSSGITVTVDIPTQLTFIGDTCNGSVNSGIYTSEGFSLAAQAWRACTLEFLVNSSLENLTSSLVMNTEATASTNDAYLDNNGSFLFVRRGVPEIFRDRFEQQN